MKNRKAAETSEMFEINMITTIEGVILEEWEFTTTVNCYKRKGFRIEQTMGKDRTKYGAWN